MNVAADAELTRSVEELNMQKDRAATFSLQQRATFSIRAVSLSSSILLLLLICFEGSYS